MYNSTSFYPAHDLKIMHHSNSTSPYNTNVQCSEFCRLISPMTDGLQYVCCIKKSQYPIHAQTNVQRSRRASPMLFYFFFGYFFPFFTLTSLLLVLICEVTHQSKPVVAI